MKRALVLIGVLCLLLAAGQVQAENEEDRDSSVLYSSAEHCRFDLRMTVGGEGADAFINLSGTIVVYTARTEVFLYKVVPQGINPTILMLDLKVTPAPGPMKGTDREFTYMETGEHVAAYTLLHVTLNGDIPCLVEIPQR